MPCRGLVQAFPPDFHSTLLHGMSLIYEGKAKRLFTTEDPNELLMEFKDDATAFNGAKKESFAHKGALNKRLSLHLYELLEKRQRGHPFRPR